MNKFKKLEEEYQNLCRANNRKHNDLGGAPNGYKTSWGTENIRCISSYIQI